jgi:fumarate hydratase, class II
MNLNIFSNHDTTVPSSQHFDSDLNPIRSNINFPRPKCGFDENGDSSDINQVNPTENNYRIDLPSASNYRRFQQNFKVKNATDGRSLNRAESSGRYTNIAIPNYYTNTFSTQQCADRYLNPTIPKRLEHDPIGPIEVPTNVLWGPATARSLTYFCIGTECDRMPLIVIKNLAIIKKSASVVNNQLGKLNDTKRKYISIAAQLIIDGKFNNQFPLRIWQTGSGTQTNENVCEVIANLANAIIKKVGINNVTISALNDVNMSQSSNDSFTTAMHMAIVESITKKLLPNIKRLQNALNVLVNSLDFQHTIKVGRTHLQDAVPISFAQEFSGYVAEINECVIRIKQSVADLVYLPIGGTAVGTGLNTIESYDIKMIEELSKETGIQFYIAPNKFARIANRDSFAYVSSTLKILATCYIKIANDIRWMVSGPHAGLNEIMIPQNEPGSSIMPGKVNPTQAEAVVMVAAQVIGNDATVTFSATQGNFEMNVMNPVIVANILQSTGLLSDVSFNFGKYLVSGIKINKNHVNKTLDSSLMLATGLDSVLGYQNAAKITQYAYKHNIPLRKACEQLKCMPMQQFDELTNPHNLIKPTIANI